MYSINPLNTELNPISPLLALFRAHHILHVSRIRVKRRRHSGDISVFGTVVLKTDLGETRCSAAVLQFGVSCFRIKSTGGVLLLLFFFVYEKGCF